jgi:hypothetical protein
MLRTASRFAKRSAAVAATAPALARAFSGAAAPESHAAPVLKLDGDLGAKDTFLKNYHDVMNVDMARLPKTPLPPLLGMMKTKAQRQLAAAKALSNPLPGYLLTRNTVAQAGGDTDHSVNPNTPLTYETPILHPSPYVLYDGETHKMGEMLDHRAPADLPFADNAAAAAAAPGVGTAVPPSKLLPLSSIMELNTDVQDLQQAYFDLKYVVPGVRWFMRTDSQARGKDLAAYRLNGLIYDRCEDPAFYEAFAVEQNLRGYIQCLLLHTWMLNHAIQFRPVSNLKALRQPLYEQMMWKMGQLLKNEGGIKRERHLEQYLREIQNMALTFFLTMDKAVYAALCGNYDLLYGGLYRFTYRLPYRPPDPWIKTVRAAPPQKERIFLEKPLDLAHLNGLAQYVMHSLYTLMNLTPAEYHLFTSGQTELFPLPAPLRAADMLGPLTRDEQMRFSPQLVLADPKAYGLKNFISDAKIRMSDPDRFAEMSFTPYVRPGRYDLEARKAAARAAGTEVYVEDVKKALSRDDYWHFLQAKVEPLQTPAERGFGSVFRAGAVEKPVCARGEDIKAATLSEVMRGKQMLRDWDFILPGLTAVPEDGSAPYVIRDGPSVPVELARPSKVQYE